MHGAKRLKLAVLISGNGSNLQALIDASAKPDFPADIVVVVSNRMQAGGLQKADATGIPTHIVAHHDFKDRSDFDQALIETIEPYDVDLICLAGFMRILTPLFIDRFQGRILNTHPSLLPKFGGEGMYGIHVHKAVIAAGETQSGCTIHLVINDVDRGEIVLQRPVRVHESDTAEDLSARVIEEEHLAYPEAVRIMAQKILN
ncbi:MAG: phosphoribosylglycinamide formyltransferase [Bdellovibrionales bacterium]